MWIREPTASHFFFFVLCGSLLQCHHKHERGQASLNSSSVCWKTSGGESIKPQLMGQRWDINIYSKLLQITFRGFCLLFVCLVSVPLVFQAVGPTPALTLSFSLPRSCIVSVTLVLSSCSPKTRGYADVEARSCFHSSTHTHTNTKRGTSVYTNMPTMHTHTHIDKQRPGQPEISIWGLSCQTWPMSLSSVIMAVFIFSDCPTGLGASRSVVLDVETLCSRHPA